MSFEKFKKIIEEILDNYYRPCEENKRKERQELKEKIKYLTEKDNKLSHLIQQKEMLRESITNQLNDIIIGKIERNLDFGQLYDFFEFDRLNEEQRDEFNKICRMTEMNGHLSQQIEK